MIGIYKITSPTGKIYIGQSKNIPDRIKRYKGLRCKKHSQESINKMSKMVLNTDTGIFYNSVKEAAFTHGINRGTLKARLNGGCINKTSLIYA